VWLFSNPEGEDLARRWLEGKTPRPSTVRKALRRIEKADLQQTRSGGDGTTDLEEELYGALSRTGHASRASMELSTSHSLRELTIGPSVDWGMRAYYVSWAGAVVWEITFTVGIVLRIGFGSRFHVEHIAPVLERLETLDVEDPMPREDLRNAPLEFKIGDD
jgi:hypothetical protein